MICRQMTAFVIGLAVVGAVGCNPAPTAPDEQSLTIQFAYGFGNELNTQTQTFIADLGPEGTVTIPMWLTKEEQSRLLDTLYVTEFETLPDTISRSQEGDTLIAVNPNSGWQHLRVESTSLRKSVKWSYPLPNDELARRLQRVVQTLVAIIESKPVYQDLVDQEGDWGYL